MRFNSIQSLNANDTLTLRLPQERAQRHSLQRTVRLSSGARLVRLRGGPPLERLQHLRTFLSPRRAGRQRRRHPLTAAAAARVTTESLSAERRSVRSARAAQISSAIQISRSVTPWAPSLPRRRAVLRNARSRPACMPTPTQLIKCDQSYGGGQQPGEALPLQGRISTAVSLIDVASTPSTALPNGDKRGGGRTRTRGARRRRRDSTPACALARTHGPRAAAAAGRWRWPRRRLGKVARARSRVAIAAMARRTSPRARCVTPCGRCSSKHRTRCFPARPLVVRSPRVAHAAGDIRSSTGRSLRTVAPLSARRRARTALFFCGRPPEEHRPSGRADRSAGRRNRTALSGSIAPLRG